MINNRFTLKFAGESGQGINSVGEILSKALKNQDFHIFGYREYPSLIRGGNASYQITFSSEEVHAPSPSSDLLVVVSRPGLHHYLSTVKRGGYVIHSVDRPLFTKEEKEYIDKNDLKVVYINAEEKSLLAGGNKLTTNVFLLGIIWNIFDLEYNAIQNAVLRKFGKTDDLKEMNSKVLKAGYDEKTDLEKYSVKSANEQFDDFATMSGNEALSLGAVSSGCRAYYAYPMTPASSILTILAKHYKDTGMVVKQAEDEITAVQMALGSMYAGTRAMTATSGGGFDLMAESVSMSGITEIPLVLVLAQRPGPATGLPTWTSTADLNAALYTGHGEFPRVVLAVSDAKSAYSLMRESFNIAEEYQVPVILLTEKQVAESIYLVDELTHNKSIRRGLMQNPTEDMNRYEFTQNGVSPRWIPGDHERMYITNTDEHNMDGSSTEEGEVAVAMFDKRMRKLDAILETLPEPVLYGREEADVTLIGWGSVKGAALDVINHLETIESFKANYLHYEYIYPLKTTFLEEVVKNSKLTVAVENNATSQLARLIRSESGIVFDKSFNKYDGRPIFGVDLLNFLNSLKL